ncbi:MAG: MotA/TolQ/ExbB proton channel family protein [Planctomycetes bacterium]|nr:MotA/TolQ/ExbB proton channel family protein [Planctomycetota bacterium]MCP4772130.1 MotA/TolQ/ExbB proton channel family protein [Planctomycetota bacterium]MCP4861409.1 MotA/TolQ/ExbB proton channel family protein [Planctomycetota bacterium]
MSRFRYLMPALLGFIATNTSLFAQEAVEEEGGTGFLEAIQASGTIGYLIIVMSVVAMALIIEHFMTLKREKLAPPEVIDEVEELFQEGNYQEALEACEASPCFFSNVTAAGIRKLGHPFAAIEKSIEEMEDEESIKLQQKIGWLSLIAGIGPMMGLFGTVTGMVGAFATIGSAGAGGVNPSDFAADISLALMTTVLGLTVAIPTTAFYAYFRNKVTMTSLEIGAVVEDMFERFRAAD